jgi:hypothetical protein
LNPVHLVSNIFYISKDLSWVYKEEEGGGKTAQGQKLRNYNKKKCGDTG